MGFGLWKRGRLHSLECSLTSLAPLEYGMKEGSKEVQEFHVVWATSLVGEGGTSLFSSSVGDKTSSMAVVPYPGEELKENEPLVVNALAVIKEHELPE